MMPPRKQPPMTPKTREQKRKATEEASEFNNDDVAIMPHPSKKPKQAPKGKATAKNVASGKGRQKKKKASEDEEEDVEDSGRRSSKEFLREASKSDKKELKASHVKAEIQDALEELLKKLDGDEGQGLQDETNMADKLRYALPASIEQVMVYDTYQPKTSFDAALATLGQISDTVLTYKTLSEASPVERPGWMRWKEDHRNLVAFEEHALKVAARQINSMIIPGKKMDAKPENASEPESVAWEIFDECRPSPLERTWGSNAMQQFKAFVGLLGGVVVARLP